MTPSGNPICFATRYDSMLPWREQGRPGREKMKKKKKKKKREEREGEKKVGASISIWKSKLALLDV